MEYVIKDLTRAEIDIMESSDLEWCPYIAHGHTLDAVMFTEKNRDKVLHIFGRN